MDFASLEDLIIAPLFFAFVLIIVIVALNARHKRRLLEHQQRMLSIEKGLPLPPTLVEEQPKIRNPYRAPLIWAGLGLGILILGLVVSTAKLVGLAAIPLCIGLGLLIANLIYQKKLDKKETSQLSSTILS